MSLDFPDLLELTADTLEIELQFPWRRSAETECTEEHHGEEQETSLEIKETCYNRRLQVTAIINWIKRKNRKEKTQGLKSTTDLRVLAFFVSYTAS